MRKALKPRLVCVGNLTSDDVYLPDGTHQLNCSGGNALYASISGRLWQQATEMVAPIGRDFPRPLIDQILKKNLRLEGLPIRDIPGIHNKVTYDQSGGRKWFRYTSVNDFEALSPRPKDIPLEYLQAEIFLVSAMTLEAQEEIVKWLKNKSEGMVALDLRDTYIPGNESRILKMISQVDIFMPSEVEARRFSDDQDWRHVAHDLSKIGPRLIVIKRGVDGSSIYDAGSELLVHVPAYPGKVLDTTGAGDSYCGGFLANYLDHSNDLVLCGRAGSVSSSFTIANFGTSGIFEATPSKAQKRLFEWK